jgi:DNA primase large subunit
MPDSIDLLSLAAKYPFSHWGRSYVEQVWGSDDINDYLLNDTIFQKLEIIFSWRKRGFSNLQDKYNVDYLYPENEVVIYLALMFFLTYSDYPEHFKMRLGGHYFNWLTERTSKLLLNEREEKIVSEYFERDLALKHELKNKQFIIALQDYLRKLGGTSHSFHISLVDLPLKDGKVILSKELAADVAADLTFSYLINLLEGKIHLGRGSTKKPVWMDKIQRFINQFMTENIVVDGSTTYPHDPQKYPPCIQTFVEQLSKGIAIPHFARFAVASFMHQIGVEKDYVVNLFTAASDFSVDKTKYQVSHIYGEIGSHTSYTAPGCDTLKVSRLCPVQGYCNIHAKHPVSVYFSKWRASKS